VPIFYFRQNLGIVVFALFTLMQQEPCSAQGVATRTTADHRPESSSSHADLSSFNTQLPIVRFSGTTISSSLDSLLSDMFEKPVPFKIPEEPSYYERGPAARVEFTPGAIERGEADEPEISQFGDDWANEVEVRIKAVKTEFQPLERIHVTVDVTNVSGRLFWLLSGGGNVYARTRVRVFSPKGKLIQMTRFYKTEGHTSDPFNSRGAGVTAFMAGTSHSIHLVPNLIYDMTRPGDYWVLVEIPFLPTTLPPPTGTKITYARARPFKVKIQREPLFFTQPTGNSAPRADSNRR